MTKKVILIAAIIVNIFLTIVLVTALFGAVGELRFEYVEQDTITSDTLKMYLDNENYGTAASLSREIRAGATPSKTDVIYYRLGEYAELLFLREVFERAGNTDTAQRCDETILTIREEMSEYGTVFDRIDISAKNVDGEEQAGTLCIHGRRGG